MQLAASCAPTIAPKTIVAIAHAESGFDALAIGDNSTGRSYSAASVPEAIALADGLIALGHSLDLGLMQINTANFPRLILTVADTFDPCKSIAAGGSILSEAFSGGTTPDETQAALRVALSRYNTGNGQRGFINGYVRRVEASARYLVPALQVTPVPLIGVTQSPARPLRTPAPAMNTAEAEGEWHARSSSGAPPSNAQGQWHTNSGDMTPNSIIPSAPPGPASVVIMQGHQGSNS